MHLEHLNTILSFPGRARGLSTLYLHLAPNVEGHVGLGTTGRAFRVYSPASDFDFVNRKNEPLEFAGIVYLLLKMREPADCGLVVTYNGKLVNAVTQATVWIIFRFKDM